jgi:CBS domain-containing protein
MGQDIVPKLDPAEVRTFTKALLTDLQALERMVDEGLIESGIRRIGAEQELFLVDADWHPAPVATDVLEQLPENQGFTTELARFNLEINLDPLGLEGDCFTRLEQCMTTRVGQVREAARDIGAEVILTGILPTLSKSDLVVDNITPRTRYYALNDAMGRLRSGKPYRLQIEGAEELHFEHDSVMLEACNTSAQFHLQVSAEEFPVFYNVAQLVAAPVLACAVNSPLLFGRQLWAETRIAVFQQSIDTRSTALHMRELSPRVRFGDRWLSGTVSTLFEEDVSRFRVLVATEVTEDSIEVLDRGGVPELRALQIHNGTVYRWNRPCYGVGGGVPHLRIECRVFPSGPTVADEVANAAFWIGVVLGGAEEWGDVRQSMYFGDAKANFLAAARAGLRAGFRWFDGESVSARSLILERLLPLAREGLLEAGVDSVDAARYLGIVRDRVESGQTGSNWLLRSLAATREGTKRAEQVTALTAATHARQKTDLLGHEWELARMEESGGWRQNYARVEQYMTTSLYTVHEDELVDLAAFLMEKNRIRHVLVEDANNELVGIVSYRALLRLLARGAHAPSADELPVKEVMERNPVTVGPETATIDAIETMRAHQVSALPVVKDGKLVGIVSERDFMPVAGQLMENRLRQDKSALG